MTNIHILYIVFILQVITNHIALQPRLDLQDNYFTKSFQEETNCLKAHYNALKTILQKVWMDK